VRAVLHLSDERDLKRDQSQSGRIDGGLPEPGQRSLVAQRLQRLLNSVENIEVT